MQPIGKAIDQQPTRQQFQYRIDGFAGFDQAETETETDADAYESPDVPFSFSEEEGKTALVCEPDPMARKQITTALDLLEYHQTVVDTTREALKRMRFHDFDLIVINEEFDTNNPDTNGVLIYIERLEMAVRRNIFVVLISRRFRTKDNMMTLNRSVNLIANIANIDEIGAIIQNGTTENEFFYRIYKESYRDAQHI